MEKKFAFSFVLFSLVLVFLLNCCAGNVAFDTQKEQIGTVIGGAVGGVGSHFAGKGGTGAVVAATVFGTAAGAWVGNRIGAWLDEKDREKLAEATQRTAVTGKPQTYENPETRVAVQTRVTKTETRKEPVTVPVLKGRIKEVPPLDLIGAPYRVRKTTNVRGGPGTDYAVVGGLKTGETITAVGKVIGKEWYLISEGGAGIGFVGTSLLTPAPATATTAMAASTADVENKTAEATRVCRTVEQIVVDPAGIKHTEQITTCRGPNGWEIVS